MRKRDFLSVGSILLGIAGIGFLLYEIKEHNKEKYITTRKNKLKKELNVCKDILKEEQEKIEVDELEKESEKVEDLSSELIYSSFFQTNIKKEYAFAVSRFIDNNDSTIFKYVTKFVFDDNGEFNYEMLKQLLTERYNNIKNIVKSEIMEMPSLTIFPLERYLNEIDTLKESNIDDRVDGILSYWVTVAESLSVTDII